MRQCTSHIAKIHEGVDAWNEWRRREPRIQPDLTRVNLSGEDLSGVDFRGVGLFKANLTATRLINANLRQSRLIQTILHDTDMSGAFVYGVSVWDVDLTGAIQYDLVVTPPGQPLITVDNLEVAQFIYLILSNEKLRDVIDTITSKMVLILGRFTSTRMAVLNALRRELRSRNYLPVLFDFRGSPMRDLTETIALLAKMARFIIADITDAKSIPQELMATVPNSPSIPVQPLLLHGTSEYGMFEHFKHYPWVLKTHEYLSTSDLISNLGGNVIDPAEHFLAGRRR